MEKKYYSIKRYIVEEYGVEATSKEEAINVVSDRGDPARVTVLKETIKVIADKKVK